MAEFTTILDGLDVMMRLGIYPHEMTPQRVRLLVEMTVDYPQAPSADRIEEVRVAEAEESRLRHDLLVEAVAALCLSDQRVRQVRVRSMKMDIYPDAAVGCEIVRRSSG